MREIFKKILWHIGYSMEKHVPLVPSGSDPRELPYLKNLPYSEINLPTELGVGLRFYSLTGKTYHPFVLALREAFDEKEKEEKIFQVVRKYSELVTFKTANDYLGFQKETVFPEQNHPYEFTYPWSPLLPEQKKDVFINISREENLRYGLDSTLFLESDAKSDEKIRIEAKRLFELFRSIKDKGYNPQYHDALNCFVLVKGEKWKWYIESGHHRAAVVVTLGYKKIPVHVRQIIRREDVLLWPSVQNGIYTEITALQLFDRLFNAEPPAVAEEWVKYAEKNYL